MPSELGPPERLPQSYYPIEPVEIADEPHHDPLDPAETVVDTTLIGDGREMSVVDPAHESEPVEITELAPSPTSFEPYRRLVADIDAQLTAGVEPDSIPGYITSGGGSHVFDIGGNKVLKLPRILQNDTTPEEQQTAIDSYLESGKWPEPPEGKPLTIEEIRREDIEPLLRGQGVEGIEQLVAYTEENGAAIICEKAPGQEVKTMTQIKRDAIPVEHFAELLRIQERMVEHGLWLDADLGNLLYDPDQGFTVIDYITLEQAVTDFRVRATPSEAATLLATIFATSTPDTSFTLTEADRRLLQAIGLQYGNKILADTFIRVTNIFTDLEASFRREHE